MNKYKSVSFLDMVVELQKATLSQSISSSVHPHRTIQPPLVGFLSNFIFEYFQKSGEKVEVSLKSDKTLHEDQYTSVIIPCSVLLRMRNVSDSSCRENENTF